MTSSNKDRTVLVTGGSGFIAVHCILKLLRQEYMVRSTLRSLSRENEVKEMLKNGGITSFDNLSFIEADLTNDKNWKEAVQGCDYVLHIASPTPIVNYKHENEMMKDTSISNCYINPSPSTEQFIANHTFMYLVSGFMTVYDGSKEYKLKPGDYGIGRRNHLARFTKHADKNDFRKIYIQFEQDFLKTFNETYNYTIEKKGTDKAIIQLNGNKLIDNFIQSLMPYFNEHGIIDGEFLNVKRSELLLILLKSNPEPANILFDFSDPDKIDREILKRRSMLHQATGSYKNDWKKLIISSIRKIKNHQKFTLIWDLRIFPTFRLHLKNYSDIHQQGLLNRAGWLSEGDIAGRAGIPCIIRSKMIIPPY